jgi:DNA recombination protein RmuC
VPSGAASSVRRLVFGLVLAFVVGGALGAAGAWLLGRARAAVFAARAERSEEGLQRAQARQEQTEQQLACAREELARLESTLEHERRSAQEKVALVEQAREELSNAFSALSSEALRANNNSFLELARTTLERYQVQARDDLERRHKAVEHLVAPLAQSLEKVDGKIQLLEQARREAYGAITEQVRSLADGQERLRAETGSLVTALRAPVTRGRWGEIQLRRVVEMAGMVPHCDFVEQASAHGDEGRVRPDLVVKLPGGKNVVVDAKAPLQSYLAALETTDEDERVARLRDHARQIRQHIGKLSAKSYWEQFRPAPEFVVLFLPGEAFYSAALDHDPGLIEEGVTQRVLLATPTTLIGVLKAVAYGWQQEKMAESARAVGELGRELYERLAVLGDHFVTLGKRLDSSVAAYNQTVGSLERRVLPTARRFADLGVGGRRDVPTLAGIERVAQEPRAAELLEAADPDPILELASTERPALEDGGGGVQRDAA